MNEAKFSKFTMALMEDSGWYKVDMSKADHLTFGENDGCDFLNPDNSCEQLAAFGTEYCKPNDKNQYCDANGDKVQTCSGTLSDGCMMRVSVETNPAAGDKCFGVSADGWNGGNKASMFWPTTCHTDSNGNYDGTGLTLNFVGYDVPCSQDG